jgi:hypothetical protein
VLLAGALLVLAAGLVRVALALDVALGPARVENGQLVAEIRLMDIFAPRIEQSLARGMPATIVLHAELWKRRTAWFDRLVVSQDAAIKVRYLVWEDLYQVERHRLQPIETASLDSIRTLLSRPVPLPLAASSTLDPRGRYFVAVSATIKPLSVEDLREGEGWLSGEVESGRREGFGVLTALPRSVFDAVRNFAGFGDDRARAVSEDFELGTLLAE